MTTVSWMSGAGEDAVVRAAPDFDALFLREHARLVRVVAVVSGDPEAAADCVADAFERAYVRWRKVGRLDDPLGWVRRVAINRATDVHRRRTRGRRALQRLAGRPDTSRSHELTMSDATAFRDSELATAMADLSPQQRAVVALHYLDDLSVADVATAMGLSDGAVKYHLHQARARLRTLLESEQDPNTERRTTRGPNEATPT